MSKIVELQYLPVGAAFRSPYGGRGHGRVLERHGGGIKVEAVDADGNKTRQMWALGTEVVPGPPPAAPPPADAGQKLWGHPAGAVAAWMAAAGWTAGEMAAVFAEFGLDVAEPAGAPAALTPAQATGLESLRG